MHLESSYEKGVFELQKKYFESFHALRSQTFSRGLRMLQRRGRQGKLLDVGTGLGFFLESARQAGWEAEGLEFSEKSAAYARQTLRLSVHVGTLESVSLPSKTYEVITLWDVLEHLPNPIETLKTIHSLLVPGGWVVVRTPVWDSLIPRGIGLLYRLSLGRIRFGLEKLFTEHLFHFSEKGLREILEKTGFRVLDAYREDYMDRASLKKKDWAGNIVLRMAVSVAILLSHALGQQDEVVIYAEAF